VTAAEQQRRGCSSAVGLGLSASGPADGDMNSYMEEILSKERSAFREQQRVKTSTGVSRHGLRRSDGARLSDRFAAQ
jgi:hypothetical protein